MSELLFRVALAVFFLFCLFPGFAVVYEMLRDKNERFHVLTIWSALAMVLALIMSLVVVWFVPLNLGRS